MNDKAVRILLVSMPISDLTVEGAQKYLYDTRAIVNVPYGLLTLCSYVKKYAGRKVEFRIVDINDHLVTQYRLGRMIGDAQAHFEEFVAAEAGKYEPDVVGISVMFNVGYRFLGRVAAGIKKAAPGAFLIVGGNLATVLHREIAAEAAVDAVVFGEGELPLLGLAESGDIPAYVRTDPAFVTRESLAAGIKPVNKTLADLDSIPPIDFNCTDLSNFNLPKQKGTVYKKDFDKKMVSRIIYTSRGCPFNCNFCAGFNVHGKKVRSMSLERVVGDVREMVDKEGLTELFVCDDSFLFDKKRAKLILNEFVKMGIHVNFPALLMRNIDDEVAELLARLGNTFQYTSLESGSDHVLRHVIQKPITKEEAKRAVLSLRKYGISVLANIVVGSPGETDEHRKETLETLDDIGFNWVFFMIALPVPGSRLYAECKENGYLVDDSFFSPSLTKCNIRTPSYAPAHIERQTYMMNLHTNFIHNYSLRAGNYDECIVSFKNVLNAYPGHAFAHYGLAKAYEGKGDHGQALENRKKFDELTAGSRYWQDWAEFFKLR
ncbi:MAG: radical SAM protein [Elusimicrobiales bacterium]|nr:radical SAM protein [Elusimicrobiales bacterium]